MSVLSEIEPKNVMSYFEQICSLPHGSGNTQIISNYCVGFAKQHDLEYIRDDMGNVIIFKKGTMGYEDSEPVIIQGHLDMVCEKDDDMSIDMSKEGLKLKYSDNKVYAQGTTLGGDDGIAVAYALAVLASTTLRHPPIEAVFTVDEEIGMLGASHIDVSMLKGRTMLNIDSEEEGIFQVSCAGGVTAVCHKPYTRKSAYGYDTLITIDGLTGGHSGLEIIKERANSNMLMGRLLYTLSYDYDFKLIEINGGKKDNAIPIRTSARILLNEESDLTELEKRVEEIAETFRNEYAATDEAINIVCEYIFSPMTVDAMDDELTSQVMTLLYLLPGGIQKMSKDIPGLVQTSLNMGILETGDDEVRFSFCVRSNVASEKVELLTRMECLTKSMGGTITLSGDYPAWEYKKDSRLREIMERVYHEQTMQNASVMAVHAGVECGIFADKLPGLDCVSFGPNLHNIHTTGEYMEADSVKRTWDLLTEVLRRLK